MYAIQIFKSWNLIRIPVHDFVYKIEGQEKWIYNKKYRS